MNGVEHLPQEWLDVLAKIQGAFPGAVIAGGAIRDTMLEGQVKDVDIFIPVLAQGEMFGDPYVDIESAYETLYEMFVYDNISADEKSAYGVSNAAEPERDLYGILRLIKEWDYDLILCTPKAAQIKTFDINICQCLFDGKDLVYTQDCIDGMRTGTLKVMNINRTDRNEARIQRILDKYPTFKVKQ